MITGSTDGKTHVWSADSGKKIFVLDGLHPGPVSNIRFNPKYMMFVSTCNNLAFWIHDVNELEK